MTLSPLASPLPIPCRAPARPPRTAHRWPIAAGLAAAALLAGLAWLQGAASPPPFRPAAGQAAASPDDGGLAEGLLWEWPVHLAGAAGMFQCAPARTGGTAGSVVVWTDSAGNILAFGAAVDGVPWPAVAAAFEVAGAAGPRRPIQVAEQGHVVQVSAHGSFVQLRDARLECHRTWDD